MKLKRGILRIGDLYARSERRPGSNCWHWLHAMSSDGVSPRIWTLDHDRTEKRVMSGPRATWNIAHGRGLGDRLAYMHCCNSRCVNPQHVRTAADKAEIGAHIAANGKRKGTSVEQRAANARKGWAARGITVTPPEIVRAVRAASGTNVAIGVRFGIAHQVVSRIRRSDSHRAVLEVS